MSVSAVPSLEIIRRAHTFADRVAYFDASSQQTYGELIQHSQALGAALLNGKPDLNEERVAYLVPAGMQHTATQWAIWQAGGVAVPLSQSATARELQYTLSDAQVTYLVVSEPHTEVVSVASELGIKVLQCTDGSLDATADFPEIDRSRRAMILYTSGTTSQPKGVVTSHANIESQIRTLVEAWCWQESDKIPLFLPLHHIHGIINVMSCALWSGAAIHALPKFTPEAIMPRLLGDAYTVFMAVPTIYVRLIEYLATLDEHERQKATDAFRRLRLMISGSAALPASIHEKWTELTGQKLLERYGMTEIGMGLSNPYTGERRPGSVGVALPGVEVRLVDEKQQVVTVEDTPGEIQIRGESVFKEYWQKPKVTSESFCDGWFRTGDMAVLESGYYRIMGRQSVDIIKSGGYKLSALEIEAVLLEHDAIAECAVVGIPDATWGEAVAVALVAADGHAWSIADLREWCRERMSKYKIPKRLLQVDSLPRNAMGKVTKPAVLQLFESGK